MGDELTHTYLLRKATEHSSKVICGLRPKATNAYLEYLGMLFFEDNDSFIDWYNTKNYWYDGQAPCDLSKEEAVGRMIRMIHGVYI